MAKIIIVGASGTIGHAVADLLEQGNKVIRAGHTRGDYTVDLAEKTSIKELFAAVGSFDALVCAAGRSCFGKIDEASDDDFAVGLNHKLMGQVNLVRLAIGPITDNGSITLTSGLLGREPAPGTVPTAMVNAALEGFVRAAALDRIKGIRINAVSPIFVTDTAKRMGMGSAGTMSTIETAKAYRACVEGEMNGQVIDVRDYGKVE